jgi:hypothetical protein
MGRRVDELSFTTGQKDGNYYYVNRKCVEDE